MPVVEALLLIMVPAALAVELEWVRAVPHLVQELEVSGLPPEVVELVVKPSLMLSTKSPPW